MGHFYTRKGEAYHQILRSDGKGLRDTNLRDAKKLKLVYSTTEVAQVPANSNLDRWKIEQILREVLEKGEKGLVFGRADFETWATALQIDAFNKKGNQRDVGARLHDQLELAYKKGIDSLDQNSREYIEPVMEYIEKRFPGEEWISEESFAHPLGFGGTVDLYSNNFIIDFKSKALEDINKARAYDSHIMQLAAYRHGLTEIKNLNKPPVCLNLFISTKRKNQIKEIIYTEEELKKAERMFLCLLEFLKLKNNYDSSFSLDEVQ